MSERGFGWVGLAWLLGACALGYEADPAAGAGGMAQPEMRVGQGGGAAPAPRSDAGTQQPYSGESCMRGETAACTCTSTGTDGTKDCLYDARSPTLGSFSDCRRCATTSDDSAGDVRQTDAGMAAPGSGDCADGQENGSETDVDCGGPDCPSCLVGKKCAETGDCSAGECVSGVCELPAGSQAGGSCEPACTQSCFPAGVLPCCNPAGRCGCTWAPGAYCL